jgi:DNA topoisomerase-1
MQTLIVAEKPSVASRIAAALSEGAPLRKNLQGVNYFEMQKEGSKIVVVAAAGHLFTLAQKGVGHAIPVFDVEWVPSFKTDKNAYFTKKYLDTIKIVGSNSAMYINACDYDVEGTVIGTNIIRYVKTGDVNKEAAFDNVKRMHFSTTTLQDLSLAFAKAGAFDKGNFEAGETRHILDWLWGINMSRALMRAMHTSGTKRVMSIGRVQGPSLAVLARREKEIKAFKPRDYWELHAVINATQFRNARGPVFDEKEAERISAEVSKARAEIGAVEVNETKLFPFPPFDLTSLQLEANRVLRMDPSKTQAVAQSLYERSYISYPRTASQKLPYSLNLPRILGALAKNPVYKAHADALIKASRFRPVEGRKEDEAHPAIYPTGEMPARLADEEAKLYDLITRRFLSLFAEPALLVKTRVQASVAGEKYEAAGSRLASEGWLSYYAYYKPQEASVGEFAQGSQHAVEKSEARKLVTKPPERYSKASLIALLEQKELGTKATRAAIIDTLFKRGYLKGGRI